MSCQRKPEDMNKLYLSLALIALFLSASPLTSATDIGDPGAPGAVVDCGATGTETVSCDATTFTTVPGAGFPSAQFDASSHVLGGNQTSTCKGGCNNSIPYACSATVNYPSGKTPTYVTHGTAPNEYYTVTVPAMTAEFACRDCSGGEVY